MPFLLVIRVPFASCLVRVEALLETLTNESLTNSLLVSSILLAYPITSTFTAFSFHDFVHKPQPLHLLLSSRHLLPYVQHSLAVTQSAAFAFCIHLVNYNHKAYISTKKVQFFLSYVFSFFILKLLMCKYRCFK